MTRPFVSWLLGAACVAALVACGSSGVHKLGGTSIASASVTSSSPTVDTSRSPSPSPSPSWTPPPYGAAKPAVDAYLRFVDLVNAAFADPARVSSSAFDKYVEGQAKIQFDDGLAQDKRGGKAYRGTPPTDRITVAVNKLSASPPEVVLRTCPFYSTSDPYTEYVVRTGRAVPEPQPKVSPPYASTIRMFLLSGRWTITQYNTDATRTCTP